MSVSQLSAQVAGSLGSSSWIRKMFEEGARLKAQFGADAVCDLALGNPHLEPPREFLARLKTLANDPTPGLHRYMPNPGFPEARSAVAATIGQREGVALQGEHVILCCGAASGLNVLFKSILDPREEVVTFAPFFPEYTFYVMHAGGTLKLVETTPNFSLDIDALAAGITPKTRAVLINAPNNPTGRVYPEEQINDLIACLERFNQSRSRPLVLVSDEPYRRLVYDGVTVPALMHRYPATVIVGSYSKDLGLAGERIGYLAMHPEFPEGASLAAGLIFCLRTLGFVNAPALMQRVIAGVQDASVDVDAYRQNRDRLYNGLAQIGYQVTKPEGAFYLFPKTPITDDALFCRWLLEEKLLTVPGIGFGRSGHIRLSYAVEPGVIVQALPRLTAAFARARQAGG